MLTKNTKFDVIKSEMFNLFKEFYSFVINIYPTFNNPIRFPRHIKNILNKNL